MTLVSFPNKFKYRGVMYAPHSQIQVMDSEVEGMRALGAIVHQHFDDIVLNGDNPEGAPEQDDEDELGDEDDFKDDKKEVEEAGVDEKPATLVIPPATNVVPPATGRRTVAPKK